MPDTQNSKYIIGVDFDGTCVTHDYPRIGRDVGAIPTLKELVEKGNRLILFTMRGGAPLQDAVNWFLKNDIPLYGININPTQKDWTNSPKAYAQIYIDDAALGCPLKKDERDEFVDWEVVREMLIEKGALR